MHLDQARGMLVGLAVGDALGAPLSLLRLGNLTTTSLKWLAVGLIQLP